MAASRALIDFITSVDGNEKWVAKTTKLFEEDGITEVHELQGVTLSSLLGNVGGLGNKGCISSGWQGFLDRTLTAYKNANPSHVPEQASVLPTSDGVVKAAEALSARLGAVESVLAPKPAKPTVHVDLNVKVQALGLNGLPQVCWPRSVAVDAYASDVAAKKQKLGNADVSPFVYQELDRFLPSWFDGLLLHEGPEDSDLEKVSLLTFLFCVS